MFLVLLLFVVIALPVFVPRHLTSMSQDHFLGIGKVGKMRVSKRTQKISPYFLY